MHIPLLTVHFSTARQYRTVSCSSSAVPVWPHSSLSTVYTATSRDLENNAGPGSPPPPREQASPRGEGEGSAPGLITRCEAPALCTRQLPGQRWMSSTVVSVHQSESGWASDAVSRKPGHDSRGTALTRLSACDAARLSTPTDTRTAPFPPQLPYCSPGGTCSLPATQLRVSESSDTCPGSPATDTSLAPVPSALRCPPAHCLLPALGAENNPGQATT